MSLAPSPLAALLASLRTALAAEQARARADAGLDAALLGVLILLLGRLERLARAWHPAGTAPQAEDPEPEYDPSRALARLLYVFGPRRNRGMAPHARSAPHLRPRSARAPPVARAAMAFPGPAAPRRCTP